MSSGSRRYLKWGAVAALVIGVYAAAGFWGLPKLLRSEARQFVAEHYGRDLALGDIRFNPFTLALEVRDCTLPGAAAESPVLAFGRLRVDLDVSSLWRRGLSFGEIVLEQPAAHLLVRPDGSFNVADLTRPFADEEEKDDAAPMRVFIDRLSVSAGQVDLEDRSRATPFNARLTPITFQLQDFSTTGGTDNAYVLTGQSAAGERFIWRGAVGLSPFSSTGHFEVADLQAATVWNYLRESLAIASPEGVIHVSGEYALTAADDTELELTVHEARVAGLGLRPAAAETDYVRLGELTVSGAQLSLTRRAVTVGRVHLDGAEVQGWLDARGRLNLLELAGRGAEQAESGTEATEASPWVVEAPDILLENLRVAFEDRQLRPAVRLRLDPVRLQLTGFSSAPGSQLKMTLESGVGDAGRLQASGQWTADTETLAAQVDLARMDLKAIQPYLARHSAITLLSGVLGAKLDIDMKGDVLALRGDTEVSGLRTVDNALRQDFVKWDRLRLTGIDYQSEPARLKIGGIQARAPYARVIVAEDRSVNIARAFDTGEAPARPPARAAEPMAVAIGKVSIENGSAHFADFWIKPQFAVSIEQMNGAITGLSSDARSRAAVEIDGKVDRYAPARIHGEINPLAATAHSDLKMSFQGLELTTVTPYSGHFAGYKIEKGKLSVDLGYRIENRQLQADHRFVIDQLQLGERVDSPDAVRLPLKLAVAVLKDRNGVIDIDLPVTGSLDDPQFRLGPIVWKAFVGLLGKVATAPFALLGNLFGGGEEMNLIDFAPGEAQLEPAAQEKLAALLKALHERPQLQLEVPMVFTEELDRAALAEKAFQARLAARAGQKPLTPEEEEALRATVQISDLELEALGRQRARAIQDALLGEGGIEAARLFVIGSPSRPGVDGRVRCELSLK